MTTQAHSREEIHRAIARHVRNMTVVRFAPPAESAGPAHRRDGNTWVLRLSPGEADVATSAALDALEELGVIPTQVPHRRDLARQVQDALLQAGHAEEGEADFGWRRHRPVDGGAHLAITCEPNEFWRSMPGQAVRLSASQHLHRYAKTLTKAELGVVAWGRKDQPEILIVAADQETADREAQTVIPRLAELNPPADQTGQATR
ncbi:hypothetical protein [Nonomuraea sp. NPDC001023]|uniref:hypothetical protein n=1 Tax=unclassified Nonomuraea TaxID=2593643 RepID=UPI0033252A02